MDGMSMQGLPQHIEHLLKALKPGADTALSLVISMLLQELEKEDYR
jgi:hypothetical protein